MSLNKIISFLMLSVLLISCDQPANNNSPAPMPNAGQAPLPPVNAVHFSSQVFPNSGSYTGNTISVGVNDPTLCGANSHAYMNLPCVQVTICATNNPANCQTINNILLDTGSYGLRIFKSVINSSVLSGMSQVVNGANQLGECVAYGDGSSQWGSVNYAYVQLGGEPKVAVPIQVIDYGFQTPPSDCQAPNSYPDKSPADAGFNGILGVGYMAQDCGNYCVTTPTGAGYFTCLNGDCNGGAYVALAAQVTNVIAQIPTDNNGVILNFPSVPASGSTSVVGTMTLGIGGHSTVPTAPTVLQVVYLPDYGGDPTKQDDGFINNAGNGFNSNNTTWFAGFIDSGSNFLYFADGLPDCGGGLSGLSCPASTTSLTYTNTNPANKAISSVVNFSVGNANAIISANPTNQVFSNIAGGTPIALTEAFDWGLPFFFGRTVYVGINNVSATALGAGVKGPFFAY